MRLCARLQGNEVRAAAAAAERAETTASRSRTVRLLVPEGARKLAAVHSNVGPDGARRVLEALRDGRHARLSWRLLGLRGLLLPSC